MATKQEKLAAARKKLKEYQGKSRDTDKYSETLRQTQIITPENETPVQLSSRGSCTSQSTEDDFNVCQKNLGSVTIDSSENETTNYFKDKTVPDSGQVPHHSYFLDDDKKRPSSELSYFQTVSVERLGSAEVPTGLANLTSDDAFTEIKNQYSMKQSSNQVFDDQIKTKSPVPLVEGAVLSTRNSSRCSENGSLVGMADTVVNNMLEPLQNQLQSHMQTIAILVQERNELQTTVSKANLLLTEKTEGVNELQRKLDRAYHDNSILSDTVAESRMYIQSLEAEVRKLSDLTESINESMSSNKQRAEDMQEENFELRQQLLLVVNEHKLLKMSFEECKKQLQISQIRIQQLNSGDPDETGPTILQLHNDKTGLSAKIKDLEGTIMQMTKEAEQSSQSFHAYAQECNTRIQVLTNEISEASKREHLLIEKNESLISDIRVAENQLQQLRHESNNNQSSEMNLLQNQIKTMENTIATLHQDIQNKMADIKVLEVEIETRNRKLDEKDKQLFEVESSNERLQSELDGCQMNKMLLASIESDKVAASRAVAQNVKLKEQLEELQKGFICVSNGKSDLAEKLETAEHVNLQLKNKIEELEKEKEKESQEFYPNNVEELKNIIHTLENDKLELLSRLNQASKSTKVYETHKQEVNGHDSCGHDHESHDHENNFEHNHEHHNDHHSDCLHAVDDLSVELLEPEQYKTVMQQMQMKLKRTMNEIALLDDEKQKLEHLVLQLQGETETIGEYITLYHRQRLLLRERTKEKDEQLVQVSQDREELRSKLRSLDSLVQSLLGDTQQVPILGNNIPAVGSTASIDDVGATVPDEPEATADRIRTLISEIGSSNLVNPLPSTFGHCPCCSGRLITV